tara:strand:- start:63 stop:869 length:807 start_codon:yes stop_codon:yes gene_type:complete
MKIWKNTSTLEDYSSNLEFTKSKKQALIALIGSKPIDISQFPNLKGIFKTGIGKDNVPEGEAKKAGIIVRYPSKKTIDIILEETASFTCGLILKMFYSDLGSIDSWYKKTRARLSKKNLLVIGTGNIGTRVVNFMNPMLDVATFDVLKNSIDQLKSLINNADCITIHIPKTNDNISFFDKEKLSWMKDGAILINTSRGPIVDENALYDELKAKRLIAAFDVYWQEPYNGKLKQFHPKLFYMTPHVASTCSDFLYNCREDLDSFIDEIQ